MALDPPFETTYDVVIIGGGTAGSVLASRLAEKTSATILLLEAGPDVTAETRPTALLAPRSNPDPRFYWAYEATPTSDASDVRFVIRGRVIGGSGAINGTLYTHGLPDDYNAWGSPRWSWDAVHSAFCEMESDIDSNGGQNGNHGRLPIHRHGRDEWSRIDAAFYEAAVAAGVAEDHDVNRVDRSGIGAVPRNITWDENLGWVRVDTARAFLDEARKRPNLTVLGDAVAKRIRVASGRVSAVEFARRDRTEIVHADRVVLCAGSLASPHLLYMSGIGPTARLHELGIPTVVNLPGVGRNLQDHPLVPVRLVPRSSTTTDSTSPFSSLVLNYTSAIGQRADMQLMVISVPATAMSDPSTSLIGSLGLGLSRGEISVRSSDPEDLPSIHFNYMSEESDRVRFRECIRFICDLVTSPPLRAEIADADLPARDVLGNNAALDSWLFGRISTAYHSVGTCKLGTANDPDAVVNERCEVYGVDGLNIADLSIVPSIFRANAFATAAMVGFRAADLIGQGS